MSVRAFFIDGPDHGTTRTFESEPPKEWKTLATLALQSRKAEENDNRVDLSLMPLHRYIRTYMTRKGVYIYEYDGILTK